MNRRHRISLAPKPARARRTQAGQALTEFLVVALAIVPLFLLIPMIAKYQDIGHATQMASRYAAFDATINNPSTSGMKDPAILAQEVRRRFFSNIDAPIRTNDAAGNFSAHQNAFWRGPNNEPLISDINGVNVNWASASSPSSGAYNSTMAANEMDAISTAEVYFERPPDSPSRDPGIIELGSLFNPYWQVRLANSDAAVAAVIARKGLIN